MSATSEGRATCSPGRLIPLGEIVGTHGVGGLLRFHPYSAASAALAAARTVFLAPRPAPFAGGHPKAPPSAGGDDPDTTAARPEAAAEPGAASPTPRALTLLSARAHGRLHLVRFEGVDRIEDAEPFVGTVLSVAESDLPAVGPGEFYAYQLEGLEVVTVGGERLGTVESLFPTGSNEVLVVRDGAREHLIPVIADVIRTIDLGARRVVIEPIAGLLE